MIFELQQLFINGSENTKDLILWQNTEECFQCSWVRSRDQEGQILPLLKPNQTYIAWIDTRWRQRFRLADKHESDHDFENRGEFYTEFLEFYEHGNYSLKLEDEIKIVPIGKIKKNYTPLIALFSTLICAQFLFSRLIILF